MNGKGWFLPILGLLVSFQPALDASSPLPIGAVIGNVPTRVNGVPVPGGAVFFSGDRITTGPSHGASIHLRKSDELVLGTSTDVRIKGSRRGYVVLLHHGRVAARSRTGEPIVVRAGRITVQPEPAGGSYEASWRGSELRVWTRRGMTLVRGGGRTVEVAAGNGMKARLIPHPSPGKSETVLMVTTITSAAAAAAAWMGMGFASPGASCVSPSQLTCP